MSKSQEKTSTSSKIGPGSYNVKNGNIPQGAAYTMIVKRHYSPKKEAFQYPGPGHYKVTTSQRPNEPVYSIGKGTRGEELNHIIKQNIPGPGKYSIKDSVSNHPFMFPPEHKTISEEVITPGPGSYRIPCRFNDINVITRERGLWDPSFKYV